MIDVKINLYSPEDLALIEAEARLKLANPRKVNPVGNKFADASIEMTDVIARPFKYLGCGHWYAAYFQHVTPVYPHTDNDTSHMEYVGIIPLYWSVKEDNVSTVVHRETSPNKVILTVKDTVSDLVTFTWSVNTGVIFSSNLFHSSSTYHGVKTGVQLIGYKT